MSFGELVVVIVLAVIVIGPKDLPKILRKLGQWSGKLRRMAADLRAQSGIDEVLREGSVAQDLAEIRKLARGEINGVMQAASIDTNTGGKDAPAGAEPSAVGYGAAAYAGSSYGSSSYGSGERYGMPSDYDEVEETILRDREYPREGADSYGALHDTAIVYGDAYPASGLAADPLYTTGVAGAAVAADVAPSDRAASDAATTTTTTTEATHEGANAPGEPS